MRVPHARCAHGLGASAAALTKVLFAAAQPLLVRVGFGARVWVRLGVRVRVKVRVGVRVRVSSQEKSWD